MLLKSSCFLNRAASLAVTRFDYDFRSVLALYSQQSVTDHCLSIHKCPCTSDFYSTCKLHAYFYSSIRSVFWRSFYFYVTCFDMQMIMQCICKLVYDKRQQVVLPPHSSRFDPVLLCTLSSYEFPHYPLTPEIRQMPSCRVKIRSKFLLNLVQTQNVYVSLKRLETDKALSWAGILLWTEALVSVNVCVYGVHSRVYFHLTPSVPSIRNRKEWIIKKIRSSYLTSNHNSYKYSQIM